MGKNFKKIPINKKQISNLKTYSLGPHFAFDASGVQATLNTGLKAIRKYGTFYNIAVWVTQV
jgi:threonine dehydrogenase-like Zn-dependent dehydrogenase